MRRRTFIKTGLIFVPAAAMAQVGPGRIVTPPYLKAHTPTTSAGGSPCTTTQDSQAGAINNYAPNDATYRWIGFNFTAGSSYTLCKLRLTTTKLFSPTGTVRATIFSNGASEPGTLLGTPSDSISASSLPGSITTVDYVNMSVSLTNATVYWVVLQCTDFQAGAEVRLYYSFDGVPAHLVKLNDGSGGTWDSWTDNNQGLFTSFS